MSEGRNQGGGEGAERDPALDRLYRAGTREEPPAHLDAAILAAARREVGARPRSLSARLRAWRVPVSIAALVVLSVSLVTLVQEEGGEQLGQPSQHDLFALRNKSASADQAASPPEAPVESEARKAPATERVPEPAKRPDAASSARTPDAMDDSARLRSEEASAPPPALARPAPQPVQVAPAPERAGPPAAADSGTSTDTATRSFDSRASISEESAVPAPKSASPPAAKPKPQIRDAAPAGEMAGALSGAPREPVAAPAERQRARIAARAQKKEGSVPDAAYVAGLIKELDSQPPEKWLERIEALRREGRTPDADEMLAEFKRRFPAHPLPEALR